MNVHGHKARVLLCIEGVKVGLLLQVERARACAHTRVPLPCFQGFGGACSCKLNVRGHKACVLLCIEGVKVGLLLQAECTLPSAQGV